MVDELRQIRRAVTIGRDDDGVYFFAAIYLLTTGRQDANARATVQGMLLDFPDPPRWLHAVDSRKDPGVEMLNDEYAKQALTHVERLTARERYYIEGNYYALHDDTFGKAIDAYKKAIELYPDHASSRNNLASAYQDAGRTAEATRLYELNLEVRERLLGPDHPSTLNSRANLAAAYRDGGCVLPRR